MPHPKFPKFVPKAEDHMPADKAAQLMRHFTDALSLPDSNERVRHIVPLAEEDKDFHRYFEIVLQADPFTHGISEIDPELWIIGIVIVFDAIAQLNPEHPNHRKELEVWPIFFSRKRH